MTVHSWFLTSSSGGKSEWVRDNGCEYLAGLYRMWRHDSNIEVGHRSPVVCTAVGAKAIMALPPDIVAPGRNTDCGFVGDLGSGKRLQAPNERNHDVVVTNGSRSARPDYSASCKKLRCLPHALHTRPSSGRRDRMRCRWRRGLGSAESGLVFGELSPFSSR